MEIIVGLQERGRFSVGEHRQQLGHSAFHWSIVVRDQKIWHRFDVTDGIVQDPATLEDLNPDRKWMYRHLQSTSLSQIPRWLVGVRIQREINPKNSDLERIEMLFQNLPLPEDGKTPRQNCLSWAVDAIEAMQKAGICRHF